MPISEPLFSVSPKERWAVCHCRPRCEKKLAALLHSEKMVHFLPQIENVRRYGRHERRSLLPLFPGYLFARIDPDLRSRMFRQDLLARIIPVADETLLLRQLVDVKKVVDAGVEVLRYDQVARGARVKVISGPLFGVEGRVEDVTSPRGIIVSVDVLQRGLLITLPVVQLEVIL